MESLADTISELERWYAIFNRELFGGALSDKVVVTVQTTGRRRGTCGWHWDSRWDTKGKKKYAEINVVAESLGRPVEEILTTLLHEMVHRRNSERRVRDVSSAQEYHNRQFKILAERVGLVCEKMGYRGWASTRLGRRAKTVIQRFKPKASAFSITRAGKGRGVAPTPTKLVKWICDCGYGVRVAKKDFNASCDDCGAKFSREDQA